MFEPHRSAVDAKKEREKLKVTRNHLFENFQNHPSDTYLALEIKKIDDQIARSVERAPRARASRS